MNTLGTLMNVQVVTYAMTCAMSIVQANFPKEQSGDCIQVIPFDFVRKNCCGQLDLAFENTSIAFFFEWFWSTEMQSPGDISGAILILTTGITKILNKTSIKLKLVLLIPYLQISFVVKVLQVSGIGW